MAGADKDCMCRKCGKDALFDCTCNRWAPRRRPYTPEFSARPCGCDPGEEYVCQRHQEEGRVSDPAGYEFGGSDYPTEPPTDYEKRVQAAQQTQSEAVKQLQKFMGERAAALAEVRITDPTTGGEKGQKECQMGAMDPRAFMEVGKVAGFGAHKYARYNFARGYRWSLSYDALQRHLMAFWDGEDRDPESGLPHLAHAAWHCLALLTFWLRGRGTDDRFPQKVEF